MLHGCRRPGRERRECVLGLSCRRHHRVEEKKWSIGVGRKVKASKFKFELANIQREKRIKGHREMFHQGYSDFRPPYFQ